VGGAIHSSHSYIRGSRNESNGISGGGGGGCGNRDMWWHKQVKLVAVAAW
jgi:hypothetical protein